MRSKNLLSQAPPRLISLPTRLSVLFSGILSTIGWIFLSVGTLVFFVFAAFSDLKQSFNADGEWLPSVGIIQDIQPTNSKINKRVVYAYHFNFLANGQPHTNISYKVGNDNNIGAKLPIQYKSLNPQRAQIIGMDNAQMPIWILFFVLIFPIVGASLVIYNLIQKRKTLQLLQFGAITYAKLVHTEETSIRVNRKTVQKYFFEFEIGGQIYESICATHIYATVEDETEELVLYNTSDPAQNLVLDGEDWTPTVNDEGDLEPNINILGLLLPAVFGVSFITGLIFFLSMS
jgi:hypothetical protein